MNAFGGKDEPNLGFGGTNVEVAHSYQLARKIEGKLNIVNYCDIQNIPDGGPARASLYYCGIIGWLHGVIYMIG